MQQHKTTLTIQEGVCHFSCHVTIHYHMASSRRVINPCKLLKVVTYSPFNIINQRLFFFSKFIFKLTKFIWDMHSIRRNNTDTLEQQCSQLDLWS